jgi:orotidine-5'-phosphate decarboxylase
MQNPIIVALDVNEPKKAQELFKKLNGHVGGFKVGPRLSMRCDPSFLRDLSQTGTLFFDHKFFDIPSTTAASVELAYELGAHWVTVHALNGKETLSGLSKLEKQIQKSLPSFKVVVVTVLTSFTEETLPPIWKNRTVMDSVLSLAQLAQECGLNSIVSSPFECSALMKHSKDFFIITPGIRSDDYSKGDQKRTMSASQAIKMGASALVVGRPIIESSDPVAAAKKMYESLK